MSLPNHNDYRALVGPVSTFDQRSAAQFAALVSAGMREHHLLLDVGCGCLALGRLAIPYLARGNYYGLEPNSDLLVAGLTREVGDDLHNQREPHFLSGRWDFPCREFGVKFDFVNCNAVLIHMPLKQIEDCFTAVAACMHRNSVFLATMLEDPVDSVATEWTWPGTLRYRFETIWAIAEKCGLNLERFHPPLIYPYPHTWVMMMLKFAALA